MRSGTTHEAVKTMRRVTVEVLSGMARMGGWHGMTGVWVFRADL
jgi:hypothetical protein